MRCSRQEVEEKEEEERLEKKKFVVLAWSFDEYERDVAERKNFANIGKQTFREVTEVLY